MCGSSQSSLCWVWLDRIVAYSMILPAMPSSVCFVVGCMLGSLGSFPSMPGGTWMGLLLCWAKVVCSALSAFSRARCFSCGAMVLSSSRV